ncbi:hypothetical protein, partial [Hymenobacter coccineus]|uniref:hypothetical protein n=1 Tax=Hymenobacter coccineus TaxID=1908235 RepID=UPI0013015365
RPPGAPAPADTIVVRLPNQATLTLLVRDAAPAARAAPSTTSTRLQYASPATLPRPRRRPKRPKPSK